MMTYGLLMTMPMIAALVCACVIDIRQRRIPNVLTLPLALGGVVQSFLPHHLVGPGGAMLGMLTGFGLMLLPYAMGGRGAGDVKLMAAVGAWIGPMGALVVFAASAVIGMGMALIQAARHGKLTALFRNTAVLAMNLMHVGSVDVEQAAEGPGRQRLFEQQTPYAVAISLGTVAALWVMA